MSHQTQQVLIPLVFPLLPREAEDDAAVFEEASEQPVSLRRKAQFFIDQKLYGRARQILELLVDLGARDAVLGLTLASLQVLDGKYELARATLQRIENPRLHNREISLCYAEIERQERKTKSISSSKTVLKEGSEESI